MKEASNGLFENVLSLFQKSKRRKEEEDGEEPLGTLWDASCAAVALTEKKELRSVPPLAPLPSADKSSNAAAAAAPAVRLSVQNCTSQPLLLCWVDEECKPHHFYLLAPAAAAGQDSTAETLDEQDPEDVHTAVRTSAKKSAAKNKKLLFVNEDTCHVEHTFVGDAFLVATADSPDILERAHRVKSLENCQIIGGYRPSRPIVPKNLNAAETKSMLENMIVQEPAVHVWRIQRQKRDIGTKSSSSETGKWSCCLFPPKTAQPPGTTKHAVENNLPDDTTTSSSSLEWVHTIREGVLIKERPFDTSNKEYKVGLLGGWPVCFEENFHGNDLALRDLLEKDIRQAKDYLPPRARDLLLQDTAIWINRTLLMGPISRPAPAQLMCYHATRDYVLDNGLTPAKAKCVELFDMEEYKRDRVLWGTGGLFVHELAHAYHDKFVVDGFGNKDILDCYEAAMKEGLYDCVRVHGSQGPECKAYACNDAMEYFAELSTAFLGGKDDDGLEYNKWFPFNRKQIQEHDPRAYEMLKRIWRVEDD